MKKNFVLMFAALVLSCGALTGCKGSAVGPREAVDSLAQTPPDTYLTAIDRYLVDSLGTRYTPGEVCIPQRLVVAVDESDSTDIRVWGDFWVFNYTVSGDTLKTTSGGNHPGLMHVSKTATGFEVTAFDAVGDGSSYDPTARRIFGEHYEAFAKVQSDDKLREQDRAAAIAEWVKQRQIPVTMYQDFGWPAVPLPVSGVSD